MCRNAEKYPEKAAIVFGERGLSYQQLWRRVQSASASLAGQLDGRRQKVVGILAPNSPEFVMAYLAVVHAGHIAMPLDITFKKLELDSVLNAVRPDLILARRDFSHLASGKVLLIEDLLSAKAKASKAGPRLSPKEQIATLFLSSGTTGRPKAIPNTHANIIWDIRAISGPMGWTADDSLLITLHLSHRHGLVICLLGALFHGSTAVIEERFSPQRTLEILASGDISIYSAVPSIYEALVEHQPRSSFDLSGVRLFASSSSTLPPFLRQAFKKRFGRQILDRYGTSETGSIAIRQPSDDEPFDSPLEGVKLRLEPGGEVALRSPGLFPGYYQNPEATRQSLTPDGWWLIGDIGEMRGGRLVLKGRSKERIIKSGYSIYPQDIEWALLQNPEVKEVRVVGLHSARHIDDKIVAFYTGSAAKTALTAYSKANLPRSWRPDRFVRLSELPKGRTNKVKLNELRELAEAKFG